MEDYSRHAERLQQMRRELQQVSATATHKDGLVTVVVGPEGRLQDIQFDPRAYRRLTTAELSDVVMKLVAEATADVADQMEKIMKPFMPEGVPYEQVLGEKSDFTAFLPQPPSASEEEPGEDSKD